MFHCLVLQAHPKQQSLEEGREGGREERERWREGRRARGERERWRRGREGEMEGGREERAGAEGWWLTD